MMPDTDPLIVSLWMDDESQSWFNGLREKYYPPAQNVIDAHLTLFHHLPGDALPQVQRVLTEICQAQRPFTLEASEPMPLGRGVAIRVQPWGEDDHLLLTRVRIAHEFAEDLTPQDQQGFRPHITLQNKVSAADATELMDRLRITWQSHIIGARGLSLWHYRGGPWESADRFGFGGR